MHSITVKGDQQSGVAHRDAKVRRQFNQHPRRRQHGTTGDDITEHQRSECEAAMDVAVFRPVFHANACRPARDRIKGRARIISRARSGGCAAPPLFRRMPDCTVRIPCYTAASRLPALVRRSEPQETAMTDDKNKPALGFQYSVANLKPVESSKIALTFPDGARREFPRNITGLDIAKGISPSLAKRTVAMALDGVVSDLSDPIERDAKIEFIARDDARALELIRHDAAHVLAEAVQSLWPGTQVTIGPTIENGFYYDFFRNEPFTPEDFAAIEKKMREIIARDKPFTKEIWTREQTKQVFRDKGENFKVELVDAIPGDESIKIYFQGDWFDLCRRPHMTSTGKVGNAFKLMKVAGAYWRGDSNNPMLTRIYGTAFAKQEELDAYLKQIEEAEKRDHRKLGRELDLFHFQEEGPGV